MKQLSLQYNLEYINYTDSDSYNLVLFMDYFCFYNIGFKNLRIEENIINITLEKIKEVEEIQDTPTFYFLTIPKKFFTNNNFEDLKINIVIEKSGCETIK